MKTLAIPCSVIVVALLAAAPSRAADDSINLYQTKCAACHGVEGAGKPAARIPSLVSDEVRNRSDESLADSIANGGTDKKSAHAFQAKGLSPDQVKMIVSYIRQLQKK